MSPNAIRSMASLAPGHASLPHTTTIDNATLVSSGSLLAVACSLLALGFLYRTKAPSRIINRVGQLPPGPVGLPIIGCMHHVLVARRKQQPVFRWIHDLLEKMHTSIICVRLGAVHVIVVACPEMAREAFRKKDAILASRPATLASESFSFGYKGSILSPHGEQWKKMRRVLTSEVLSPAMEHRLQSRRAKEADHIVRFVYNQCGTTTTTTTGIVDVRHVAQHFCGNLIRSLMFSKRNFFEPSLPGSAAAGPGPDEVEHVNALFTLVNNVFSFKVSDYFPRLIGLDLDGHEKVVRDVMSTLNRLHDPIIEERIHEWSALRQDGHKREINDFLDVLVSIQDSKGRPLLSLEEIKAQTAEIMFAIVDNPSNAVEWALAEMVTKPEVMKKAIDELDTIVGKERLVQESDIPHLNYNKACIRESFRLHPYHAFNPPHVAMEDTTIGGYFVPKGSSVLLSRVGLGRNPDIWEDPLQFRPERHLNTSCVGLTEPDLTFISFSTGRRGCPGVSLGTSTTMMLFARLVQCFTWTKPPTVHKTELKESATSLALAEPLVLQAEPRLPAHLYEST